MRVKIHRSYTVQEITVLFGVHKNTVLNWVKNGLPVIDNKRPMLIHGLDLRAFLKKQRKKNKQTCKPGELYCVKCRVPKLPAVGMVDFKTINEKIGHLKAICPDCNSIMNRRVRMAEIEQVCIDFGFTLPIAQRHIVK